MQQEVIKQDQGTQEFFTHPIYRVRCAQVVGPYTLHIVFDDDTEQTINFQSMLGGAMYGPLRDLALFNRVQVDPEVKTIVWPNGADFDPATLHDWPQQSAKWSERAEAWQHASGDVALVSREG